MPSFKAFLKFTHHIVLIIYLHCACVRSWFVFIDKCDQCCGSAAVFGRLSTEELGGLS